MKPRVRRLRRGAGAGACCAPAALRRRRANIRVDVKTYFSFVCVTFGGATGWFLRRGRPPTGPPPGGGGQYPGGHLCLVAGGVSRPPGLCGVRSFPPLAGGRNALGGWPRPPLRKGALVGGGLCGGL